MTKYFIYTYIEEKIKDFIYSNRKRKIFIRKIPIEG